MGLLLSACTDTPTVPKTQWWAGYWVATAVDGRAMPVTFGDFRYDLFAFRLHDIISSFDYTETLMSRNAVLNCSAQLNISTYDTHVATSFKFANYSGCSLNTFQHTLTRVTDTHATIPWQGHVVTFARQ